MKVEILCLLLLVATFSQSAQEQQFAEPPLNQEPPREFNLEGMSPEERNQYNSMRRTACLVLSRYYTNSQKESLDIIIKEIAPQKQQKFINKMYSKSIQVCEESIQPDEVQQFFIQNNNFDPSGLFTLFTTIDFNAISKQNYKLTKNQEGIVQYIKQFDQQMEVRRQQKAATQQKLQGGDRNDFKIFGISTNSLGLTSQLVYVIIFVAIFGGLIFLGFRELNKDDKKKTKSKKQSRSKSPTIPSKSPTIPSKSPKKQ